jgi:hypothetical protein
MPHPSTSRSATTNNWFLFFSLRYSWRLTPFPHHNHPSPEPTEILEKSHSSSIHFPVINFLLIPQFTMADVKYEPVSDGSNDNCEFQERSGPWRRSPMIPRLAPMLLVAVVSAIAAGYPCMLMGKHLERVRVKSDWFCELTKVQDRPEPDIVKRNRGPCLILSITTGLLLCAPATSRNIGGL